MDVRQYIRKIIRETIDKIVDEPIEFDAQSVYSTAVTKALNDRTSKNTPRIGIADDINNYNEIVGQIKAKDREDGDADILDVKFKYPTSNLTTAPTLTNLYEDFGCGIFGQTAAGQEELDKDVSTPSTGLGSIETQEATKEYNDNINRQLFKLKYPSDDTGGMKPPTNTDRNW